MKLCIHCKFFKSKTTSYGGYGLSSIRDENDYRDQCLHDNNKSLVDGSPNKSPHSLRSAYGNCGREGKWFEPKQDNKRKDSHDHK